MVSRKEWPRDRLQKGLVFNKLDAREKVLVEYILAEYTWTPVRARGYIYVDCLQVSDRYKGKGYGDSLMGQCTQDSRDKGKLELVCISPKKRMPFLSDPGFMRYKGFKLVDTSSPYLELLYLSFGSEVGVPWAKACAKDGRIGGTGWVLYYSNRCLHVEKCTPLLTDIIKDQEMECRLHKIDSREAAQLAPALPITYASFYSGKFVTNEVLSEKSFAKLQEHVRER